MNNIKSKSIKKSKNSKSRFSGQQLAIIILSIIVSLLTIVVIAGGWFMSYLWQLQRAEEGTKITTLILQAIDGLSNPAPIDAQTGKAYIPQAKLVLPMMPDTFGADIEYSYSPAQNDPEIALPEELRIVNIPDFWRVRTAMISAQGTEAMFKEVPQLQACARGYQLTFSPLTESPDPVSFTKQLSDGRMLYAYLDSGCEKTTQDFEDYLKQIDSY